MIAALFVETNGCYSGLPGVEPWDVERDARRYPGAYAVVAHPPCERWGRFFNGSPLKKGYELGADDGCFESALAAVDTWGGVLEHPAGSKAWDAFGLRKPDSAGGWRRCGVHGWVCYVEQGHYGHPARKGTWLFATARNKPDDLIWGRAPQRLPARRLSERGYESARRCGIVANLSHNQRQRTPIAFRDVLLSIVESRDAVRPAA